MCSRIYAKSPRGFLPSVINAPRNDGAIHCQRSVKLTHLRSK